MYRRFHKGLVPLAKLFNVDITPLTEKWCSVFNHMVKHHGKKFAVNFLKEMNTIAERYALHQNIDSTLWVKSDKDKFPKVLGKTFKSYLRSSDPRKVIMALSVMRTCEVLTLPISKDISSIIDPCKADENVLEDILSYIPQWVSRLKPIKLKKIVCHLTVKNGPNGQALRNSDSDILAVRNDTLLSEAIQKVESKLGASPPMKNLKVLFEDDKAIHSKLSQFPDKAGKTRTIAVVDYYSQRCLKPLHESVMDLLASLVTDGTYSHQAVGKYAMQMTSEKRYIYCADLTAATDRFPKRIQEVLLHELVKDDELAQSLWTLLAERTFKVAWSEEKVSYQCGQPMGCYASWPIFALAHHLIVEYSAYKAGIPNYRSYRLIGDDVIITDKSTATIYRNVMEALGVSINKGKTVESSEASDYSSAEVAKQLYLNGICLTPMTPGFIRDIRKPYMFNTCMRTLLDRYEFLNPETPSTLIDSLFRKEKTNQLVWLLASNPVNGTIKPDFSGYYDRSPWVSVNPDIAKENYFKIILNNYKELAMTYVDQFIEQQMPGGSLWNGVSRPLPTALRYVYFDINKKLTEIIDEIGYNYVDQDSAEKLVAEFDFVPNPSLPFSKRKELRHRRMSSVIESLYNYDDSQTFVQLDW